MGINYISLEPSTTLTHIIHLLVSMSFKGRDDVKGVHTSITGTTSWSTGEMRALELLCRLLLFLPTFCKDLLTPFLLPFCFWFALYS